ncbi:cytochrome o ubiquinol oxidase subunit III [Thiotrichales bacterium 19X7-9]|nr:cytochrome o ubiquinol oxidase subunit III [Thiotrichales bacterium 19X7-9]TNF70241.1 MAG: cytochrome o ubiquinol oxidase subunit III [Gammaproteobacteria bacterium]UTW41505.1 cytochrome o ubiquinol oxidase subunit III [bacterium SCSIO 12844]
MSTATMTHDGHIDHHEHHDTGGNTVFGFWIYIMSDCILFSSLFATFVVMRHNTFGGPTAADLVSIPYVFVETILLLCSSFTYGLAMLSRYKGNKATVLKWLLLTFILGASFIAMELYEFYHLVLEGNGWYRSGFLSSFFTLVGTHGLHVTIGLIWMVVLMIQVSIHGVNNQTTTKLSCLGLFWHFLDIVWIFVFTIVYLMGAI